MRYLLLILSLTSMQAIAHDFRYLALGDSYTICEGMDRTDRWPNKLTSRLRERDIHVDDPTIIATTGWTTDELDAAMDRSKLRSSYDLVSLLIGVNNQYRHRSLQEFRVEFRQLAERAVGLAAGRRDRVFILSIPDWTVTPYAQKLAEESDQGAGRDIKHDQAMLAEYNSAVRELAEEMQIRYFDITPSTLQMNSDNKWVASDGLHPAAPIYDAWVDQIIDGVAVLLSEGTDNE